MADPTVELGEWRADLPAVRAPHLRDAKNCLPILEGYEPLPSLTTTTNALNSTCLGAAAVRDINQATHMYAGTSTKLYKLIGFTWTDYSKVGGYGPVSDGTHWRFATYGDRLLATNATDNVQYIDMSTAASAFANLPGLSETAAFVVAFGEFVLIGQLSTSSMAIKWSGFGDSEEWTPGTNQSDEQEFPDGGRITGLAALDVAYIFQEKCIRRMAYVGGLEIMSIDKVVDGIGCVEPQSLIQWGSLFFFLSEDGWYLFDGAQAAPIGTGKFDKWFQDHSNRAYWNRMSAGINPTRKLVCWAYCSDTNGNGIPDRVLYYNWVAKKATYGVADVECLVNASSLGISIDDLTSTDIDVMTISFDDPYFLGGASYFAGFDTAHKLGSFAGSNLAATLETGFYPLNLTGRTSIEYATPITDAASVTIAGVGVQQVSTTAPTFQPAVSKQTSGKCPQRNVNGNFIAFKMTIAAAQDWTFATSINFKAKAAGAR